MTISSSQNIKTKFKPDFVKLGLYQIIGSAVGIAMILFLIFKSTGLSILIVLFMFLFFAYSLLCGMLCFKLKQNALQHSLINQFLQLISFAFSGYAFTYVAGIYLTVGFDFSNSIEISFGFGISGFNIGINQEPGEAIINLNLVAFGLIFWIEKLRKKIRVEKEIIGVASIGQI